MCIQRKTSQTPIAIAIAALCVTACGASDVPNEQAIEAVGTSRAAAILPNQPPSFPVTRRELNDSGDDPGNAGCVAAWYTNDCSLAAAAYSGDYCDPQDPTGRSLVELTTPNMCSAGAVAQKTYKCRDWCAGEAGADRDVADATCVVAVANCAGNGSEIYSARCVCQFMQKRAAGTP